MPLNDALLRNLGKKRLDGKEKKKRHADRDGLYVFASETGTLSFRFDFFWPPITGRKNVVTFGRYPVMSLQEARDAHIDFLRELRKGVNPLEIRRQQKRDAKTNPPDFKSVGMRWYAKAKVGKSSSWMRSNLRYLNTATEKLGPIDVRKITPRDVSGLITPIEEKGFPVVAEKVRQTVAMILDYAADKPEFLLDNTMPNPARRISVDVPDPEHHAHIPHTELPDFLNRVDADESASKQFKVAARLLTLTWVRSMELLGARWAEFDFDNSKWTIPAERMKGRKVHVVPLARQALVMFQQLKEMAGSSEFVFPKDGDPTTHLQDDALRKLFRRASDGRHKPHGSRSTASTALNELGYRPDAIERQLAHIEEDEVRASYNHSDYWKERVAMMADYAEGIDRLCAGLPFEKPAEVKYLQVVK